MRPYRIVQVVFIITIVVYSIYIFYEQYPWYGLVVILLIYLIIVGIASFNIQLNFFVKAYCEPQNPHKNIAITFDDGPSEQYTMPILKMLKKYNAKASFFCIGKYVEKNPDIVHTIANDGHAIGNHSYHHGYLFGFLSAKRVVDELSLTNDTISATVKKDINLFRPPYGVTNPPIARAVQKTKMKVIGWNVRSFDTLNQSYEKILKRILPKIRPGSVILLHDNREDTIKILEGILQYVSRQNFKCVDVYEMFELDKDE